MRFKLKTSFPQPTLQILSKIAERKIFMNFYKNSRNRKRFEKTSRLTGIPQDICAEIESLLSLPINFLFLWKYFKNLLKNWKTFYVKMLVNDFLVQFSSLPL